VQVFGDRTDRLDAHNRNRSASVIERQAVLSRVRRLDGDPLSRAHGTHHIEELVVVAVLPNSFCKKSRHLIIGTAVAGADKPGCMRCTIYRLSGHPPPPYSLHLWSGLLRDRG